MSMHNASGAAVFPCGFDPVYDAGISWSKTLPKVVP
jgi:hypothetical protein